MNIAPSLLSVYSSLHAEKEPWPGHRCGETEARSRLGLPPRFTHGSRAETASWASHTSSAQIPDPSPAPSPQPRFPRGTTSPRCSTHSGRGEGPWGPRGRSAGTLRDSSALLAASPPQTCRTSSGRVEGRTLRPSQAGPWRRGAPTRAGPAGAGHGELRRYPL